MLSIVIFEKELWGKGIAAQATKDFIKEVFNKYDVEKIGAFTYAFNDRSIGLLEKIGFSKIEIFIEDGIEHGPIYGHITFASLVDIDVDEVLQYTRGFASLM